MIDSVQERLNAVYRERRSEIESLAFASSAGFSTYVLLKLTSYFPDNWVLLLSVLNFFVGLKNTSVSFLIILLTFSISIIYQNAVLGIVILLILLFALPAFDGSNRISQALALSVVPLMYYRAEFFSNYCLSSSLRIFERS